MAQVVYKGYTPEELQQQYSARAAVPEHPAIFERWRAESAAWRGQAPAAWLDLAYGEHSRQRIDLFHPDGRTSAPLHVFFHGGYWQSMERSDFSFVARGLNDRGIAAAVVGYRLCPEVSLAAIVDDASDALAWLNARRARYRLDDRPLQLSGHSAGGHLAAMLAATEPLRFGGAGNAAAIDWIAPVSGVFELEPLVYTALNQALGLDVSTARELSPLDRAPASPPSIDAWVGADESDEFRRQSAEFVQRWSPGNQASLHGVPGCNHFTVIDALFAPAGPLVQRAAERIGY